MGGVSSDQGKDTFNVELNLVPFIDLLSSLVLFLLLTAVWVQISSISTKVDAKGPVALLKQQPEQILQIHLSEKGYEISIPPSVPEKLGIPTFLPKLQGNFDNAALEQSLRKLAGQKSPPPAAVSAEDNVGYEDVIHTIDSARAGGLPAVALSAN